ncbi:MAG: amidohydrolase family protein [Acidimicrobiia bacterium]|jgi:predicted TIM-barrel fold metal-dependent hydrolase
MRIEDLVLVSVDDHVVEPPDLFDGRLAAKYVDQAPKLIRKESGIDVWSFRGAELPNIGLNAVAGRPPEEYAMDPTSFDQMRPGCYDVHSRVKDMDANGVLGSMNFPSFPQFCGQLFARTAVEDADLALALLQAYNDWHIEGWCGAYPGRFIPLSLPPMWDPELMAAEVRRVAEMGCHAVTFSENPTHLGHPSIHSGHWDPFFAACEELGTVVCVHIGSSSQMVITAADAPMDVLITLTPVNLVQAAADFVWSKVPQSFPNLKYALSEGGIGWIPYFRERIDYTYDRHRYWTGQDMGDRSPSQVFDEQVICCWIDDPVGVEMRNKMNIDMITWECDYPHSDSTWPQSPEQFMKQVEAAGCSDVEIDKMSHLNAMRLFQYDPFATLGGKDSCTVGALRARAEGWDVSVVAQGIKATGTGAMDLANISAPNTAR